MAKVKEGAKVRVASRPVTADDRRLGRYYEHMAGLTGTVGNIYEDGQVSVVIDKETLSEVTSDVHEEAVRRMREKFLDNLSEEGKKQLTQDELNFTAHFVHLVQESDLEPIG